MMSIHVWPGEAGLHMQGLGIVLTDVLVREARKQSKAAHKAPPGYSPLALHNMGPVQLQSKILNTTLASLEAPEDWRYFGKHGLPVASNSFVTLVDWLMRGGVADIEDADSDRYQHFKPYFAMLCESLAF